MNTILIGDVARIAEPGAVGVVHALACKFAAGTRCALVCDTLSQEEFNALTRHLRACGARIELTNLARLAPAPPAALGSAGLVRPEANETLVPADVNGLPSLEWYDELLKHAFGSARPAKCLVLWGSPGVGKTLAAQRLGEMVQRRGGAVRAARLVGEQRRRLGTPEYGYFSCCDVDDAEDMKEFVDAVAAFGASAPDDSILVLDDLDVPGAESTEASVVRKLIDIVTGAKRLRRVLIVNDLYAYASLRPRAGADAEDFTGLQVHRAHVDSLAAYLQRKISVFAHEPRAALVLAANSGGDVRRALTSAQFDAAVLTSQSYDPFARPTPGKSKEPKWKMQEDRVEALVVQRANEPLYTSLERYARCARPELQCRLEQFDNIDDASQILYVNYPRFVTGRPERVSQSSDDTESVLDTLAVTAELMSQADVYDQCNRNTHFAGTNGVQLDKQIHFALALGAPITVLARQMLGRTTFYTERPIMRFPHGALRAAQNRLGRALLIHRARRRLVADTGFANAGAHMLVLDKDAHKNEAAVKNACDDTACVLIETARVLFGRLSKRALKEALALAKKKDKCEDEQALWQDLVQVARRFGEAGFAGVDFAQACLAHFGAHGIEHEFADWQLVAAFNETKAPVAYDERVLGEQRVATTSAAATSETNDVSPAAKRPKRQSMIDSMLKRVSKK